MPLPPAGSPHRGNMPPLLLSSASRSAFPAADDGDNDAAVCEQPCVTLLEWWLATVEGDDQKIAVAGTFEWKGTLQELSPAPIVKRHLFNILESEDGTILLISGSLNTSLTLGNGYSNTICMSKKDHSAMHCSQECLGLECKPCMQVCKHFMLGFPHWWQSCNLRYPKLTNSDTGCQPCSSNTRNSGVDPTQFYLEKSQLGECLDSYRTSFISKHPDILKSSSRNDSVFPKSSHLSNGKLRSEEHTCDGDIATNENAAASSEAGKGDQRTPVVSLEVRGCGKETRHVSLTEKAAVDEEMPASVYLDMQNTFCLSNGTPILEEYTCDGDIPTNEETAASNDDNERYTVPSKEVNNMEIGLVRGRSSRERGHDDIATDVSLAPTVENTNNAVSEAECSTPATVHKRTPVACLKSQCSWVENQHVASDKKVVFDQKKCRFSLFRCGSLDCCPQDLKHPVCQPKKQISPHEKRQSAIRSPGTRSSVSYALSPPLTRGKATSLSMSTPEALKLKRTRSGRVIVPTLDEGCQSIVYGRDGSISGVIGLDSPATPKWSESKTDRWKKRTE